MLPDEVIFPEFVPDQVLTSDDLNNLFGFLDEQGRMTRSNLIGIGIVCGLQVKTPTNRSSITITKGVGVTSQGYLVRVEADITYTSFEIFDAVQDDYYEKFVNESVNPKEPKFDLWELKLNTAESPLSSELSTIASTLDRYLVLLFVELLKEQNKNCDPNSCDDKGINTTFTIKPLLVLKNAPNINSLIGTTGNPLNFSRFYSLDEIKMPRYNVPNTSPIQTEEVLKVYFNILNDTFLTRIETALTAAYTTFSAFLGEPAAPSPFAGLKASFDFIRNITTKEQLLYLQYYYDIISDLLQAYDEFRKIGNGILSTCCPNPAWFPRHLLLGEAVPVAGLVSAFRHYFIYSPLFEKKNLLLELKFLFSRMELMKNNIFIPPFVAVTTSPHEIRITPSILSDAPLSQKAIPYYYKPLPLYPSWSFDKTLRGKATQNLSYHATTYNTADDFARAPLKYDLEPFNFLRIEGHIGLTYTSVVRQINNLKKTFRLPIDVIALSTGEPDLRRIADGTISCNIRDLETSYEIIRREWEAIIGKMIEYLHDNQRGARSLLREASTGGDVLAVYLVLLNRAKTFMVTDLKIFISRYDLFLVPVYEQVEIQSLQLRTFLVDLINNEVLTKEAMTLAEDLIDHFDEVILSCKKGGFRSIFQQFNSRISEIYGNMFFGRFVEKHPGIQHKAGVPMGGTFIIVYHATTNRADADRAVQLVAGDADGQQVQGTVRNTKGTPVAGATVSTTGVSATTDAGGRFSITLVRVPSILSITAPGFEDKQLAVLPGTVNITLTRFNDDVIPRLADGTVIADFYLPYLCSSNCTPIQFVIQEVINQPPVANAGLDQDITLPQESTSLDGSDSSDPERRPLAFSWALVSGQPDVTISDPTAAEPRVSNMVVPGEYIFALTVTDEEDATSNTDQVIVRVHPRPNNAPTANAGEAQTITLPDSTVDLAGQGSDIDNDLLTFRWSLVSGPVTTVSFTNDATALTTAENLTAPGPYVFRLTVSDGRQSATDDVTVTVARAAPPIDQPPFARAGGPLTVALPATFAQLDGSESSDPVGRPITFEWINIGPAKLLNSNSATPVAFDLNQPIEYNMQLKVTNDLNLSSTDNVEIQVTGERRGNCSPLSNLENSFKVFAAKPPAVLDLLRTSYKAFAEIDQYFKTLGEQEISLKDIPVQLRFFSTFQFPVDRNGNVIQALIVPALQVWLSALFELIQLNPADSPERENEKQNIRSLTMGLYNILVGLAAYITCIQRDPNNVPVNTAELFKIIQVQVLSLDTKFIEALKLDQPMLLIQLRALFDDEVSVIEKTGQQDAKRQYMETLQEMRSHVDTLVV